MKHSAAFFDIDGTISREGMISEMFKKMIKYELIDSNKWYSEVKPSYVKWDRRLGDYDTYLQKMVDIYTETVIGTDAFHIRYIANKVIEQKGERVYAYSRERIRWHREQGHKVIAVSGSPIELVRAMSEKYGMDDYRGTIYEVDENGRYTGGIIPMWDSRSKQQALHELAEKHNIDFATSYAYGDTTGDLTMMGLVGNPVAVNPTRELLSRILEDKAIKQRIQVVVERKDVTYRLHIGCLDLIDWQI